MALLVLAPTESGVQKDAVLNPSYWGLGTTHHQCGFEILSNSISLPHWDVVGAGRQQVSVPEPQNV